MINFPDAPTPGQIYTSGQASWAWDGGKWTAASGGSTAYAPLNAPVFTGDARAVTPATADNDTSIATTAYVQAQGYATAAAMTTADNLRVLKAGDTMTGNLGIGTSPTHRLHIAQSGYGDLAVQDTASSNLLFAGFGGSTGYISVTGASDLNIQTNGSNRVTVNSAGNVGIGTTGPAVKLQVAGDAAAGSQPVYVSSGPDGTDTTSVMLKFTDFSNTVAVGQVNRNGSNTVAYATSSDVRLKQDISPSERGLDALMAIEVSDYRMGDDVSRQGLLAQQVAEHYPEAVVTGGEDPQREPWMIDYGRLTPLLIKAVQELSAKVAALEGKPAEPAA